MSAQQPSWYALVVEDQAGRKAYTDPIWVTPAAAGAALPVTPPRSARSLRFGQIRTIVLLFGGYAACYFCRADLSVATPLMVEELGRHGVSHGEALVRIGTISSARRARLRARQAVPRRARRFLGRSAQLPHRPRRGDAVHAAVRRPAGTLPLFTLAWFGNRLTQSIAWAGLIKVSSQWFDYSSYGTIVGILSISYLVGDAAGPPADGRAHRARLRLARAVPVRGRRRRG